MQQHHQGHRWDVSPREAIAIQRELAQQVVIEDRLGDVNYVAGVDVGLEDKGKTARAAIAVLRFPELELVESVIARRPVEFPYVPGLLSFRELPVILDAQVQLKHDVGLYLCDGQGIAHPRRLGIACHLGLILDAPTIGVAKTRLIGKHAALDEEKGSWVELMDKGEVIGAVLRSRRGVKPLYISPGHRISLSTSLAYVMACVTRYRLPETTRWAHRLASG